MRRMLIFLLLMGLVACSSPKGDLSDYKPEQMKYSLETYAEEYPLEYKDWGNSIHGQEYLKGNRDVPACTDCHTEPELNETQTATFRLEIPNRCGRCHSDENKMSQYDVPTNVVATYLADYHGTTIEYYRKTAPDGYRYEAVCSDCHSSHAILPADDTRSSVSSVRLQGTCQKCHHNAPINFTAAYGHYEPARAPVSSKDSTIVFLVKLFYQAMIPVILGGMIGYIFLDIRHRMKKRKKEAVEQATSEQQEGEQETDKLVSNAEPVVVEAANE